MKNCLCFLMLVVLSLQLFAQEISTEPISKETEAEVQSLLLSNRLNKFMKSGNIQLGRFSIGPILHFVSFNPIEGTRFRLSGNVNFPDRLTTTALGAVGTKDKSFKWALGTAYRFPKSRVGENTLSVSAFDNTYLPAVTNYDNILNSIGKDDDFFLLRRQMLALSTLQNVDFEKLKAKFRITASRNRVRNYQPEKEIAGIIARKVNFMALDFEIGISEREDNEQEQVIVARYQQLQNAVSLTYGLEFWIHDPLVPNRNRLTLSSSLRVPINDYKLGCWDIKLDAGWLPFDLSRGGLFYPRSQMGFISEGYNFLLLPYSDFANTGFVSAITQLNSGGLILQRIPFMRRFHVNEFLSFKSYFSHRITRKQDSSLQTLNYKPYYEISAGVSNVFDFLGFEIAYSSLNSWGCFLRLKVAF